MNKHYFYNGVYQAIVELETPIKIENPFSGVISVDEKEEPGPVYKAIIQEWFDMIMDGIPEENKELTTVKIALNKMERIE